MIFDSFFKEIAMLPQKWVQTPVITNVAEEREKFFNSKTYNPFLSYKDKDLSYLNSARERLDKIEEKYNLVDLNKDNLAYINKVLNLYRISLDLQGSIGNDKTFSELSKKIFYRNISTHDYKSWSEQKEDIKHSAQKLNAESIKKIFIEHIERLNWDVTVSVMNDMKNTIRINAGNVRISANVEKTLYEVQKILVHELYTHVLRFVNYKKVGSVVSFIKFPENYLVEEGLALLAEEKAGYLSQQEKQKYYLRYTACKKYKLTFREYYEYARDHHISKKDSFSFALRMKRGMTDTSKSGIHYKDSIYLAGYDSVKNISKEDLVILLSGKVSMNEITNSDIKRFLYSKLDTESITKMIPDHFSTLQ